MITEKQKRFLKSKAHSLKPVVITGEAGISEGVLREIDLSLEHHELIKVRVNAMDREERKSMIDHICKETNSDLVQSIGHIAILYRAAKKPVLSLPN